MTHLDFALLQSVACVWDRGKRSSWGETEQSFGAPLCRKLYASLQQRSGLLERSLKKENKWVFFCIQNISAQTAFERKMLSKRYLDKENCYQTYIRGRKKGNCCNIEEILVMVKLSACFCCMKLIFC